MALSGLSSLSHSQHQFLSRYKGNTSNTNNTDVGVLLSLQLTLFHYEYSTNDTDESVIVSLLVTSAALEM